MEEGEGGRRRGVGRWGCRDGEGGRERGGRNGDMIHKISVVGL